MGSVLSMVSQRYSYPFETRNSWVLAFPFVLFGWMLGTALSSLAYMTSMRK
jgi:hypothetical protein